MRTREPTCRRCGLTEDAHHAFDDFRMPIGCVCEPQDWGNPYAIPDVCAVRPVVEAEDGLCVECHHLAECHVVPSPAPEPEEPQS